MMIKAHDHDEGKGDDDGDDKGDIYDGGIMVI